MYLACPVFPGGLVTRVKNYKERKVRLLPPQPPGYPFKLRNFIERDSFKMGLCLNNKRWVVEFQRSKFTVKCVFKESITTEEQVLEEIEKYKAEHPDAEVIDYYLGIYDVDEDDYVKVPGLKGRVYG